MPALSGGATGKAGMGRWALFLWAALLVLTAATASADEEYEQVEVVDPFIELHTGPGRGYPIFYIAERGERVAILRRRTDWFKVRTVQDKVGWVSREQMERTLTDAGVRKTFRDVLYEDYLQRRFEAGFSMGQMTGHGIADRDVALSGHIGYRFNRNQSIELSVGQVSDDFFSGSFTYLSLVSQPYPEWTVSPVFSVGFGRATIEPKATLISAPSIDTEMANAGVGARVYFARRFFVRLDLKEHRVFVDAADRTDHFKEISFGIGFFF